jgi:hypothetical protein
MNSDDRSRERAPRTGRGMHNALGYQLRQVSKQLRELQKQALAQNTRPDEAETPKSGEVIDVNYSCRSATTRIAGRCQVDGLPRRRCGRSEWEKAACVRG